MIAAAVGLPPRRFRAPYYDVDERVETVASSLGLAHTPGTVTPPDWRPSVRSGLLVTLVLQLIGPAGIIGLHDGIPPDELHLPGASRAVTVETVAAILPRLNEAGYAVRQRLLAARRRRNRLTLRYSDSWARARLRSSAALTTLTYCDFAARSRIPLFVK